MSRAPSVQLGTPRGEATEHADASNLSIASDETIVGSGRADGTAAAGEATTTNGYCEREGLFDHTYIFGAVDAWRGPLDGESNNNFGTRIGFNAGAPLFREYGIGAQFGMSYGIYDFHGREDFAPETETSAIEEQLFFTAGVFQRCTGCGACDTCGFGWDRVSWGVVYDYMITDNTSACTAELNLGQIRGQVGYCLDEANEVGVQGSIGDGTDDDFDCLNVVHTTRAIDQLSVFWHHVHCTGIDTRVYTGIAEELGEWVIGASAQMPVNDCCSVFAGFTYIMPSARGGDPGFREEFWNVSVGVAYYLGGNAITHSVCGHRWMPLLPVADNGSFVLDLGF